MEPDFNFEGAVVGCQMVHHNQEAFVPAAYLAGRLDNPSAASCTSFVVTSTGCTSSVVVASSVVVVASSEDSTSFAGCITWVAFLAAFLGAYLVNHTVVDTVVDSLQQLPQAIHKQVHHVQRSCALQQPRSLSGGFYSTNKSDDCPN